MSEQLKEWLPNPTFVDYQVPHNGQGADFYDEDKMLEYGKHIIRACCQYLENEAGRLYGLSASEVDPIFQSNFELCAEKCYDNSQGLKDHFGVEE